jgi:DUF177 domain-containing protein
MRVPVADLLRHPGERREIVVDVPERQAHADLVIEAVSGDAIVATGKVTATWTGECRRCLGEASGTLAVDVRELFERGSDEEETYSIDRDQIDVEPLVRDAVLLEVPLAPLCREACKGLCPECGANRNEVDCGHEPDTRDPRWAVLDHLKDQ